MKRYRIYLIIILFVFSGAHHMVFSQNSKINTISLEKPDPTIYFDPVAREIEILIAMNTPDPWGQTNQEGIGFFSLSNDYSWVQTSVDFSLQHFYLCEFSFGDYFTEDTNFIYLWLYDPVNLIDSVTRFTIVYDKPQIKLDSVGSADLVPSSVNYVVYEPNPTLYLSAQSLFPSTDVDSYINKIILKENSVETTLWDDDIVPSISISRDLPDLFTLLPGDVRTFTLTACGKYDDTYGGPKPETSKEFSFTLTYLSLQGPDQFCKVDKEIALTGRPEGGKFDGPGIDSGTKWFNPSRAANGPNMITYFYNINGTEFSTNKTVFVIDKPEINLSGPLQVCENSTDVLYTITGANPDYNYTWTFEGIIGGPIYTNNFDTCIVHWKTTQNKGSIVIDLAPVDINQACPASFDYFIDIDPDPAPDKGYVFFLDQERKFLASSNTEPKYYDWYMVDETGDTSGGFLRRTYMPYLFLDTVLIHDMQIDISNQCYAVSTGNLENGCFTLSPMPSCGKKSSSNDFFQTPGNEIDLTVYPNPSDGSFELKLSGIYNGKYDLRLLNLNNQEVQNLGGNEIELLGNANIKLHTNLQPGMYILQLKYGIDRKIVKKIIIY
jgi:hypothetical protein